MCGSLAPPAPGTKKAVPDALVLSPSVLVITLTSSLVPDALVRGSDRARGTLVVECSIGAIPESGIKLWRVTVPRTYSRLKPPCPLQIVSPCVWSDGYPTLSCYVIRSVRRLRLSLRLVHISLLFRNTHLDCFLLHFPFYCPGCP